MVVAAAESVREWAPGSVLRVVLESVPESVLHGVLDSIQESVAEWETERKAVLP